MKRKVLIYGIALASLAFLLSVLEYYHFVRAFPGEMYLTLIAVLFMAIGIWAGRKLATSKSQSRDKFEPNIKAQSYLGISEREMDVLKLIAKGYSNQQIADQLYISIHTVKSHVSNLLTKLEVNRRTQAIQKARSLKIIP